MANEEIGDIKMGNRNSGAFKPSDLEKASADSRKKPRDTAAESFDADLKEALHGNNLSTARTIVADAEAILATHDRATQTETSTDAMTRSHLASAKARIAISAGDPTAARAILVQAIERWPDVSHLRAMMTEVMLASGRAQDVRPVLMHLGREESARALDQTTEQAKKDSAG